MNTFLKMTIALSLIVSTLFFHTVCIGWSESEPLLTLERWTFQVKPGNYSVRFTIRLSNDYERPIQKIDAFLYFEDAVGNALQKVYIRPYIKIPPRGSQEHTWTTIMNPFSPMLRMKPEDIRAKLVVRELNFSAREGMAFSTGSVVIY